MNKVFISVFTNFDLAHHVALHPPPIINYECPSKTPLCGLQLRKPGKGFPLLNMVNNTGIMIKQSGPILLHPLRHLCDVTS